MAYSTERPWADSLSEEWLSQHASSSPAAPGTINSLLSSRGLSERRASAGSATGRIYSEGSEAEAATVRKGVGESQSEWKRHVLGSMREGPKDLLSPTKLEELFKPAQPAPQPSLPVVSTQPLKPAPSRPRKSFLPVPALSTLLEESSSSASNKPTQTAAAKSHGPARAGSEPPQQLSRPLPRPVSHMRAQSTPGEALDKKGKRKAERYADIDHDTRSKIILPKAEAEAKPAPKPRPRILRPSGRWSKGGMRSSSEEIKSHEVISPVSVSAVGSLQAADKSPPSEDADPVSDRNDEGDDTLGSLPNHQSLRKESKQPSKQPAPEAESSVYPSSPPFMEYRSAPPEEDFLYDESYQQDQSRVSLGSPFTSPDKVATSQFLPPCKATPTHNDENAQQTSQSTPKLTNKLLEHGNVDSSGAEGPFFTPHPYREVTMSPSTPPLHTTEPSVLLSKDSKSPMKLFHSSYDTYTGGQLERRLNELQYDTKDDEAEDGNSGFGKDESSEEEFSGGSLIVNRLEAMARTAEKRTEEETQQSPVVTRYRHVIREEKTVTKEVITKTTAQRVASEPVASAPSSPHQQYASGRKHHRWLSDDSASTLNDGVNAPKSPLRDRTPKRLRRSLSEPFIEPIPRETVTEVAATPRRGHREHLRPGAEGGVLTRSVRRERNNSNASKSSSTSLTPSRRRKRPEINNAESLPAAKAAMPAKDRDGRSRDIIFSGNRGDGMEGHGFHMPEIDDDIRRSSFTTTSWLRQACDLVETIAQNPRNLGIESSPVAPSLNFSVDKCPVLPSSDPPTSDEKDSEVDRAMIQTTTTMLSRINLSQPLETAEEDGGECTRTDTVKSQESRTSRASMATISNGPEVMKSYLASKGTGDMYFNQKTQSWITKAPAKQDTDPFQNISDITIDSKEEQRALKLAREQWGALGSTPNENDKSGLWRSSRAMDDAGIGINPGTSLVSSTNSESSQRTIDSAFLVRTETRTTSYGSLTDEKKSQQKDGPEVIEELEEPGDGGMRQDEEQVEDEDSIRLPPKADAEDSTIELPPPVTTPSTAFSSSPVKGDLGSDGPLERDLRRSSIPPSYAGFRGQMRRRSGRFFISPAIPKISEEEEYNLSGTLHPDIVREMRRVSMGSNALTPVQTPFKPSGSAPPSSGQRRAGVSFHLSPLPDLSYQFETTEALISLEVSYITQRRGPKATSKAIEASFSIAQSNLIKHLTDVEPYEPYWEYIKSLKLTGRKIETLHTLNEWCPKIRTLDASENELGQLTGVPESIFELKLMKNCLSDATYFGHLVNLEFLDISGNELEGLSALRGCLHLRELRADDNALTSLAGIFSLEGLTTLRCRRNKLESVDFSKAELTRLTDLDLRGNQLMEVVGLAALPALVHLNLDQNQLSELALPSSVKIPTLKSLKLTQNRFESLSLKPFPNLRTLYMDDNQLNHLSGASSLTCIDAVSIRSQRRQEPLAFVPRLLETRKLYLANNPATQFLNTLAIPFLNLQYLELASCQLRSLPENFASLFPNLRVLNLNHNQITDLTPVARCVRLVKLSVVGNALDSLATLRKTLAEMRELRFLDLRMNPLTLPFYPPPHASEKVDEKIEYVKTPFELPAGDPEEDARFIKAADLETRCQRRRCEMLCLGTALKIKELNGLVVDREEVEQSDEVYAEMAKRGWVREEEYEDQSGGEGAGEESEEE